MGLACSKTGKIAGPWEQVDEPLVAANGAHGMIFKTFDGKLMMTLHQPNSGDIRAEMYELDDLGHILATKRKWALRTK